MNDDVLESSTDDLAEARATIDEARESLRRALESGGGDEIRRTPGRPERIVGEPERTEGGVAGRMVGA